MGIWLWYSELSRVMQAVVAGVGVVVIGLLLRWVGVLRRPRRSTVYVRSGTAAPTHERRSVSIDRSPIDRLEATPGASLPDVAALRFEDGRSDEEGEPFDREMVENEFPAARPQSEAAEWARGSALSPEARAEWAGELTTDQLELRREARSLFDYLRSGDRPDTSEVLDRADAILEQLRELADRPRWVDE